MNNKESTRKYSSSGTFVDLCDSCFGYIEDEVPVIESPDIDPTHDPFVDDVELDDQSLYGIGTTASDEESF